MEWMLEVEMIQTQTWKTTLTTWAMEACKAPMPKESKAIQMMKRHRLNISFPVTLSRKPWLVVQKKHKEPDKTNICMRTMEIKAKTWQRNMLKWSKMSRRISMARILMKIQSSMIKNK